MGVEGPILFGDTFWVVDNGDSGWGRWGFDVQRGDIIMALSSKVYEIRSRYSGEIRHETVPEEYARTQLKRTYPDCLTTIERD